MTKNTENKPVCNILIFRFFFRTFFEDVNPSDEEFTEILNEFSKYLREKLPPEKILEFVPKSHMEVIAREHHPFYTKGFNPGFVLHFTEFVKLQQEKD